ncbi:hypothetical protein ACG04R_00915 [Roseateles sp. BYS78W]|uniref:XRE family transcriptional regulator n=1 Tax=Pelomonas candidula TaxID=3299025 RepID=A0ABW7H5M6_9BURK
MNFSDLLNAFAQAKNGATGRALANALAVSTQDLDNFTSRRRVLPNIALVKISEELSIELVKVIALSEGTRPDMTQHEANFWGQYID